MAPAIRRSEAPERRWPRRERTPQPRTPEYRQPPQMLPPATIAGAAASSRVQSPWRAGSRWEGRGASRALRSNFVDVVGGCRAVDAMRQHQRERKDAESDDDGGQNQGLWDGV